MHKNIHAVSIRVLATGLLALASTMAQAAGAISDAGQLPTCCAKPPAEFGSITWRFDQANLGVEQYQYEGQVYDQVRWSAQLANTGYERWVNGGIVPSHVAVQLDITSANWSTTGGVDRLQSAQSLGGLKFYDPTKAYPALAGYPIPYIMISNLDIDANTRTVTADLGTNNSVTRGVKLFSYDTFAYTNDPTADMGMGPLVAFQTSPLMLTAEGRQAITQMFGMDGTEKVFAQGWGTMSVTTAGNVPEASSLSLMGLGLVGVAGVTRLRRKACAA